MATSQSPMGSVRSQLSNRALTPEIDTVAGRRLAQVQYAASQAAGYPIGSGSTESANKLLVDVRMKGSGMHWARAHVNPLVALRTLACTNRWAEVWPRIRARLRLTAE